MDDGGARCHSEQPCSVVEVVSDPGSGRAAASIEPESCVNQFYESHDFSVLRRALRQADEEWMEEFLQCDGLLAVFDALSAFNGPVTELDAGGDGLLDALPQLECVECLKAVMNSPQGMEAMIRSEGGRFVHRLVLGASSRSCIAGMARYYTDNHFSDFLSLVLHTKQYSIMCSLLAQPTTICSYYYSNRQPPVSCQQDECNVNCS